MKAIIGVEPWDSMQTRALRVAERIDKGQPVTATDYHLNFADAVQLFHAFTPSRLALLEWLEGSGPASIDWLKASLNHDHGSADADIDQLIAWDLIAQDSTGQLFIPWDAIEIRVTLSQHHSDHGGDDCHAKAA